MNFNLIPDKMVNDFQKVDDESAIIDILSTDKIIPPIVIRCNPYIKTLKTFITIKDKDIDKLIKFTQQETNINISVDRLASSSDYNVIFRIYDESGEYVEFGVIDMKINTDGENFVDDGCADESGFDVDIRVHTFDNNTIDVLYLEDAEYIELYDKQNRKIKVNTYDESLLAEYIL